MCSIVFWWVLDKKLDAHLELGGSNNFMDRAYIVYHAHDPHFLGSKFKLMMMLWTHQSSFYLAQLEEDCFRRLSTDRSWHRHPNRTTSAGRTGNWSFDLENENEGPHCARSSLKNTKNRPPNKNHLMRRDKKKCQLSKKLTRDQCVTRAKTLQFAAWKALQSEISNSKKEPVFRICVAVFKMRFIKVSWIQFVQQFFTLCASARC